MRQNRGCQLFDAKRPFIHLGCNLRFLGHDKRVLGILLYPLNKHIEYLLLKTFDDYTIHYSKGTEKRATKNEQLVLQLCAKRVA